MALKNFSPDALQHLVTRRGGTEVAVPHIRDVLVRRVSDFLIDAAGDDADRLLVATTRPRGYAPEFTSELYEQLTLTDLTTAEALAYASKLADVRHSDDPDTHDQVTSKVSEAAAEDLTARLMHTPPQGTIMSLLLGRPSSRTAAATWPIRRLLRDDLQPRDR